jgi:class 3 adenylate cyclase
MRRTYLFIGLLLAVMCAVAQDRHRIDSLNALLDSSRKDTVQLKLLNQLRQMYWGSDTQVTINDRLGSLANELLADKRPAVRNVAEIGQLDHLFTAGVQRLNQKDLVRALRYFNQGRTLADRTGDRTRKQMFKLGLLWVYTENGDTVEVRRSKGELFDEAAADHDTSAMIQYFPDPQQSPEREATLEQRLLLMERYASTRHGYAQVELIFSKVHVLVDHGRWKEALATIRRCTMMAGPEVRLAGHVPVYYGTLGPIYEALDSVPQAIRAFEMCQRTAKDIRLWDVYCSCSDKHAAIALKLGDRQQAERQWLLELDAASQAGLFAHVVSASRALKELYDQDQRPAKMAAMMEIMMSAKDSMAPMDAEKDIMRMEFRDAQLVDSLANAHDQAEARLISEQRLGRERFRRNVLLFSGLGLFVFGVMMFRQRNRTQKALRRSDELLLNILPQEVAEELKASGTAEARHFDSVTILFTDFKGFTEASEKLTPQELVEELNTCFKAFDHIITARGIEKIKTIGDAYMAAGGLPDPASSTPADVVHAGLEMQAFMQKHKAERDAQGLPAFEMRVGIHTGPVVAGIVGVKKFQYDIWGDTVNTASRMESSGEVGQVNISETTYLLVKDAPGLTFTARGKVQAKGKGEMEMFFVGARPR